MSVTSHSFSVYTTPKGQPRVKAASFGGHARVYTPTTAAAFKADIAMAARDAVPAIITPWREAWSIGIVFYMPRPKRLCRKSDPRGAIPCVSKPDLDNLLKAALDALVSAGIVDDDRTLFMIDYAGKYYAEIDDAPRVECVLSFHA